MDFDRLNRETNAYRSTCVDRFNPSTRSNYSTYTPTKTYVGGTTDRYNPSTRGNYTYFDPTKTYR